MINNKNSSAHESFFIYNSFDVSNQIKLLWVYNKDILKTKKNRASEASLPGILRFTNILYKYFT